MKRKIKHQRLDSKKVPELKALANLVGDFIEYWGFKSVHGRMWCYIYLIKQPLDSRQLAQLLQISPALVTQTVQTLLQYKVIFETDKGVNGVLRFTANPNVSEAIAAVLANREQVLLEKVQDAQDKLSHARIQPGAHVDISKERVEQIGMWVGLANLMLSTGIQSLREEAGPFDAPLKYKSMVDFIS
jgi:DNA-binding transcriptional regulator GbsR (MarR family)